MSTTTLVQLRDAVARKAAPIGRAAFWIDDPQALWLVGESAVDVFVQRRTVDAAGHLRGAGARHHLFRAQAGQLLLGFDPASVRAGWGLVAVPLPDARLHPLTTADLESIARDTGSSDALIALTENWAIALSRGLRKPIMPKQFRPIGTVDAVTAEEHEILASAQRILWLTVSAGNALWLERYDAVINAASGPIPLPNDLWLKAPGSMTAQAVAPADLLASGALWKALALHHGFVLRHLLSSIDEALARESARLEDKANRSMVITQEALQRLMSLGSGADETAQQRKQDTLLSACEQIGRRMKIDFRMPAASDHAALARDPVATMANAAKVRFRRVALKEEWWLTDNGPLLGAYAEGGVWVALLPKPRGGYELHDPATGAVKTVDETVAAGLNAFATMFYRVFPSTVIKPIGLLAWGMHGLRRDIILVIALGILMGGLGMLTPIATGKLVDTFIPAADRNAILQIAAALIATAIATSMFEITRTISILRLESKMDGAVQAAVWDRVLKLPVPFFRKYAAGDLAMRINGINTIRHALSGKTVSTLLTSLFSVFNFALLFYYSAKLAGIAALLVAVALIVTLVVGYLKLRYERKVAESAGKLSAQVFQYLSGIAKLRVSSAESRAFSNWARSFTEFRTLRFSTQHLANVEHTFFSGYSLIISAVIFAAIGMFLTQDPKAKLSTGEFIAFNSAFGAFFGAMMTMSETLLGLLNLVPVYERAKPILESLPEVDELKAHPGELQGAIEIVKLGFRYGDGPEILKDLSFSIRPGGYVALVGASGSGKSTLFRLMLGFEQPTAGSIYYDNQDIGDLDMNALRRQLGVVLQSGQLMAGDIFTNIVGTAQLSLDDAWEAARMVGLEDDINQMPMGMHTVISEGASTLSGGQRQRILIARAIVNRPRILFFDEATSALDNRTQAIVSKSLDLMKATRIVIAHRLSTIVNADRILVMQDGRVVQDGNYDTLIGQTGPFAELAKRQIV